MDLENTGKEWREEAPLLSAMDKKDPFTVPDNYFTDLQNNITSRCLIEDARFRNEEEFTVPAGYFDSLVEQTEGRIAEQTVRSLVSSPGLTVPDEYFSTLHQSIVARTSKAVAPAEAVVRPLRSNWFKYAAAACVTAILGSVLIFSNQDNSFESGLSRIPDQDIINYLQMHSDVGDTPLILESLGQNVNLSDISSDISDAELEEYISTTL